jgi:hypothetical protein
MAKRGEGKEKDQHFLLQMEACMTREREREISHFTLKIVSTLDINILIWVLIPFLSRKK